MTSWWPKLLEPTAIVPSPDVYPRPNPLVLSSTISSQSQAHMQAHRFVRPQMHDVPDAGVVQHLTTMYDLMPSFGLYLLANLKQQSLPVLSSPTSSSSGADVKSDSVKSPSTSPCEHHNILSQCLSQADRIMRAICEIVVGTLMLCAKIKSRSGAFSIERLLGCDGSERQSTSRSMSKADTYFKHIEVISKNKNISMFEDTGGTVGYTIDALQSCDGRSKRRRDSIKVEEANSVLFRYNRTY
uniref:Mediator of RNA polymerase II transcription subunit 13 n=1 Tax=Ascaris lumbricoides TaxID=6252 RepID=A0A0M3IGH3_ASCLU